MNKKVLIVEDEPTLKNILVDKLSSKGYDVSYALNGKEGLNAALKNHPDVIILDIIMPIMDGISMLDELRKDAWGKGAEVVILTNLTDPQKEVKVTQQGVCNYLIKCDMTLDQVVNIVEEKLQDRK
jgi:DNA-binding response OmpR family regulator